MSVPGEVDIERRHRQCLRAALDHGEEAMVLVPQPLHSFCGARAVQPVHVDHFLREDALPNDGTGEVQGEDGSVVPVATHHPTDGQSFLREGGTRRFIVHGVRAFRPSKQHPAPE